MSSVSRIRWRLLVSAALLAACQDAPPPRAAVSGDPLQLTFAPALNVKLDSTELRPSGLYVHDLVAGTGAVADSMSTVEVHYTGWLADGTKFDGSREQPNGYRFTVGIGQVIGAWDEGIRGMRVGGKRQLIVPPKLGYGDLGMPPDIPRMASLVFEVELVAIGPAKPAGVR